MSLDHQVAAEVTNEDTMNAQVTPQKRKKMDLTKATEGGASASSHPFSSEAALKQAVNKCQDLSHPSWGTLHRLHRAAMGELCGLKQSRAASN